MKRWPLILAGWVAGALPFGLVAETVRVEAAADAGLFSLNPDFNLGLSGAPVVGGIANEGQKGRLLLRFDVPLKIPASAIIRKVRLHYAVVRQNGSSTPVFLELHRMLKPWVEGLQGSPDPKNQGGAAKAGEPTWNERAVGSAVWEKPGAGGDSDRVKAASAQASAVNEGAGVFESTAAMVADVQSWVDRSRENHGWLMVNAMEDIAQTARRVATRESGATGPVLEVEYTVSVDPQPVTLESVAIVDGALLIHYKAPAGAAFTVETSPVVEGGVWTVLTNFSAPSASLDRWVTDGMRGRQGYFRVTPANGTPQ